MKNNYIRKCDDCPNCGKKEGAFMGMSKYSHSINCCSEPCLKEIEVKLNKNESSPEYRKLYNDLINIKSKMYKLRYKGINGDDPYFKL